MKPTNHFSRGRERTFRKNIRHPSKSEAFAINFNESVKYPIVAESPIAPEMRVRPFAHPPNTDGDGFPNGSRDFVRLPSTQILANKILEISLRVRYHWSGLWIVSMSNRFYAMSGLYINTTANSLASIHQLQRTAASMQATMTQLSTGLQINSGKDDPAGLIASELMRADITATNAAIKNTERANLMLNVAESGMRQISSLLNEAKGLAVESANTGAMSPAQIAANQLQMNEILNSIDRFSGMTNWLGKPLLDGSFSTANGGATFQIGPDVVANQQVNVGIESTRTASVGNVTGTLADLRSGGAAALAANPALADSILSSAISQIATQRGSIGATQKYTLDASIAYLQDSLVQSTAANALISNTDFAVAASNLMRDQILFQAGMNMLGISNQNAAYAALLLR